MAFEVHEKVERFRVNLLNEVRASMGLSLLPYASEMVRLPRGMSIERILGPFREQHRHLVAKSRAKHRSSPVIYGPRSLEMLSIDSLPEKRLVSHQKMKKIKSYEHPDPERLLSPTSEGNPIGQLIDLNQSLKPREEEKRNTREEEKIQLYMSVHNIHALKSPVSAAKQKRLKALRYLRNLGKSLRSTEFPANTDKPPEQN